MIEEEKRDEEVKAEESADKKDDKNVLTDPEEQIRKFGHGKLRLCTPIRANGQDVTELVYDFTKLTGNDYVDAMDTDTKAVNLFRLSGRQALALFAAAAGKATPGIDATDIRERMNVQDTMKAVQLATVFFAASNRAGNNRISNE